jgi:hypothetical protein
MDINGSIVLMSGSWKKSRKSSRLSPSDHSISIGLNSFNLFMIRSSGRVVTNNRSHDGSLWKWSCRQSRRAAFPSTWHSSSACRLVQLLLFQTHHGCASCWLNALMDEEENLLAGGVTNMTHSDRNASVIPLALLGGFKSQKTIE